MSDTALQWITERASQAGMLACAVRRPDGQCISHSVDPSCPAAVAEGALAKFDALAAVTTEVTVLQWSTWIFEQGQIRLAQRPDGWRLALVVRNESAAAIALDAISQEFLASSFGE